MSKIEIFTLASFLALIHGLLETSDNISSSLLAHHGVSNFGLVEDSFVLVFFKERLGDANDSSDKD